MSRRTSSRINKGKPPPYLTDYITSTPVPTLPQPILSPVVETGLGDITIINKPQSHLNDQPDSLKTDKNGTEDKDQMAIMVDMMNRMMTVVQNQNEQINKLQSSFNELESQQNDQQRKFRNESIVNDRNMGNMSRKETMKQRSDLLIDLEEEEPGSRICSEYKRKIYDLPVFTGEPELWPGFYSSYNNTTEAYNYTNLENMYRLQKSLSGVAREAVSGMLIYPESVPDVMSELEFRFGRPEMLVKNQLSKLKQINNITEDNISGLINFSTKVKNMTALFVASKLEHYLMNPTLLDELISKLPMSRKMDWAKYREELDDFPTIANFNDWLNQTARRASLVDSSSGAIPKKFNNKPFVGAIGQNTTEKKVFACCVCKNDHVLQDCEAFTKMNMTEKMDCLRKCGICFICLKRGHLARDCKRRQPCDVNGCERFHHKLLHESSSNDKHLLTFQHVDYESTKTLFKVVPVRLLNAGIVVETFALLDEGSFTTIMDQELADKLNLSGQQTNLTLRWYDDRETEEISTIVNCCIEGTGPGCKRFELNGVRTVRKLKLPLQSLNHSELEAKYPTLVGIPYKNYKNAQPMVLIGLNNVKLIKILKTVDTCTEGPLAAKTPLGWVIYGPCSNNSSKHYEPILIVMPGDDEQDRLARLEKDVAQYLEIESFGVNPNIKPLESKENERAMRLMEQHTVLIGNRYQTGLLWKADDLSLPNNLTVAKKRLDNLLKKLKREGLTEKYQMALNQFCEKGYARKLTKVEAEEKHPLLCWQPHFGVTTVHKPDKIRVVHDAAAKIKGVSLNDLLLTGPDLTQPMLTILLKFREGQYVVIGDLTEMFNQILIQPSDRVAQRYIWKPSLDDPLEYYEMTRMTFGAACSPSLAQYVKNNNAERFTEQYPDAVMAIKHNFYVDDYVKSFQTPEQAVTVTKDVKFICNEGGFKLSKLASNSAAILKALTDDTAEEREQEIFMKDEKILGMRWNSNTDRFYFTMNFYRVPQEILSMQLRPTKRQLLSLVMSMFDPFGFLADFMIHPKVTLQKTWEKLIDWDNELPDDLYDEFCLWINTLHEIDSLQIPRCYSINFYDCEERILNVFVDASETAMAVVAYWVLRLNNEAEVSFIMGKTRCAPKKACTIPRLELQAAVLGSRLCHEICKTQTIKPTEIKLWSDSQTVLNWIRSDARKYKPYVAHRIAEILSLTEEGDWNWIPTHENPADDGTRLSKSMNIDVNRRWIQGPEFLKRDPSQWSFEIDTNHVNYADMELKNVPILLLLASDEPSLIDVTRFSKYTRLVRSTAFMFRFIYNLKRCKDKMGLLRGPLTIDEMKKAEIFLFKEAQSREFCDEIHRLRNDVPIEKKSSLLTLTPYIDDDGVLRCGGRIDAATVVPLDTRRPIILPSKDPLTCLILQHYHEGTRHQMFETTISRLRKKYWIPAIRARLKNIVHHCQECKLKNSEPKAQQMAPLPSIRFGVFQPVFTYTGVDYFGPIEVTVGRKHYKRWVALFICMTVGAVHLEIAEDLSTDAFIMCLRNFMNLRGKPKKIRSDRGTNFVGYTNEILNVPDFFDTAKVEEHFSSTDFDIEWTFNCPGNPEAGGRWERMVQMIKRVLKVTLNEQYPRESTLRCYLLDAMNIVNDRPLTHVPLNHDDDEVLTPNMLMLGHMNSTQTPTEPNDRPICTRKQWRIAQQLKNHFWKRWMAESLPMLVRRTKWTEKIPDLKVGQLVYICDPEASRNSWRRGRITEVFEGRDGLVRTAMVKTSTGYLKRPACRLAVLDVNGGSSTEEGVSSSSATVSNVKSCHVKSCERH